MLKSLNKLSKSIRIKNINNIVFEILKKDISSLSNESIVEEFLKLKKENLTKQEKILAYAIIKESVKRILELDPYSVQILGSLVLNAGKIAEMKTGEGKTLVSIISAAFNFLQNKKTHIITANDYLAERDYEYSKKLFNFLNISSEIINSEESINVKKLKYNADVLYGTSKTFVFDYLRDNIVRSKNLRVQDSLDFAIIDEVDSILIDEARIPMNMSSDIEVDLSVFNKINELSKLFIKGENKEEGDFYINLKDKSIEFTDEGFKKVEELFIQNNYIKKPEEIYSNEKLHYLNNLEKSIRANHILKKDVDYVILNEEIVIIDENTGRLLLGRRWNGGLHQAVEAKENLKITSESITIASITLQNYFRLYNHLSGMTGTALTEEEEFVDMYSLEVFPLKTNKPMIREDKPDVVFKNKSYLFNSLIKTVKELQDLKRPVLIGTQSLSDSEIISDLFIKNNIKHEILNAKNHLREAKIIAEAGCLGSVTISTNMAGRGTDIMLGGNKNLELDKFINIGMSKEEAFLKWKRNHDSVVDLGGLFVIGIERSEARRLDNQLIGRSGRQGDPGTSVFYISLEDELLKPFAERANSLWSGLGIEEEGVSHPIISRTLDNAQKKKEGANYNARKNLLKYDNINSEQRNIIYKLRNKILDSEDLTVFVQNYIKKAVEIHIKQYNEFEINDLIKDKKFNNELIEKFDYILKSKDFNSKIDLIQFISEELINIYFEKRELLKEEIIVSFEKEVILKTIDDEWIKHLSQLENMRKNVSFKVYANKNPIDEYQKDSLEMFNTLLNNLKLEIAIKFSNFSPLLNIENEEKSIENIKEQNKRLLPIIVSGAGV